MGLSRQRRDQRRTNLGTFVTCKTKQSKHSEVLGNVLLSHTNRLCASHVGVTWLHQPLCGCRTHCRVQAWCTPAPRLALRLRRSLARLRLCCCDLDPLRCSADITHLFSTSRDWDELKTLWVAWRNESGRKMATLYEEYVALNNEAAKING